jgi:hypothetical protein
MLQQGGSYIDLKNCTIFLRDGYSEVGAVNNMAGYMIGGTTVTIDGVTGKVPVGASLKFTGDETTYYVTATTETLSDTTSITIDPPLVAALTDNQVITFTGVCLEIKVGEGTLSYSETKNREYKLNRGKIDKVRNGDEAPMEVSTTFAWTHITAHSSETTPTVEDFLKRRGPAAAYISTGSDCDPYAVDLVIVNAPPGCTGETYPVEYIIFPEFRYEKLDHDAKAGTVSMTGKCNAVEPSVERFTLA